MNSKEQLYSERCYLPKSNWFVLWKSAIVEQLATFWDVPMSKRPEMVNTMKAGGSGLDHPRAVNSNGKVILTVCMSVFLYACASMRVHLRACVAAYLHLCHPWWGGGGESITFCKLIRVPLSPGVGQCFCLYICLSALTSHALICHKPSFFFA